jgi:hypothetical protein
MRSYVVVVVVVIVGQRVVKILRKGLGKSSRMLSIRKSLDPSNIAEKI